MNAAEFVETLEFPCVFFAGVGCPGGTTIAVLDVTELSFSLEEVEGEVTDGILEGNNLNDGTGAYGWKFHDWNGNTIYKIQVFNDEKSWCTQNRELHGDES